MNKPLISICIPTYNQTKYLRKVLDSVFEQTFTDYEVIVSDDSTTNDVKELIDEYTSKSNAIRYFHHSPGLGSPKNWNFAMQQAQGEFIKIMHHDDWFIKAESLEIQVNTILQNQNSFVFSYAKSIVYGKESTFYSKKNLLHLLLKDPLLLLITQNLFGPPSGLLFKKDILLQFDYQLIWLVDMDFYIQLMQNNQKPLLIEEVLYVSMIDDHNITNSCRNNKELEKKEFNYIVKKHLKNKTLFYKIKWYYRLIKNKHE